MKTLTLLRHAKSGWDDAVLRDFDRPLNAKGQRAAVAVGCSMKRGGQAYDRVVASPAVRVVETLEHLGRAYGRTLAPAWDRRLYLAAPATILDVVHEQDDALGSVMVVGHNPGLEELVLLLAPDGPGALRDSVAHKFPTASAAVLTFAVDRWADVVAGGGTLMAFTRPRDLDPALGPDED
ncbi:histidine phosphatase family protein [Sphingomonas donggukensis]|uniref:Histidine phosphatase family protein n=1 Tax=Sphingomonas donggukensis TaxID=2949093 RepID=A0ABY4TY58_9SPHN|nr:histidine phosphatase family protein [Sphingomonas donggukensis]URW75238.1 histidine phosphatase family protein [Sphingomonas donggukensis]